MENTHPGTQEAPNGYAWGTAPIRGSRQQRAHLVRVIERTGRPSDVAACGVYTTGGPEARGARPTCKQCIARIDHWEAK